MREKKYSAELIISIVKERIENETSWERLAAKYNIHHKPVGVSAIQEIHSAKTYYKCKRAAVVAASAGFTKQAIELSEKVKASLFIFDDYAHEFTPINSCAQSFLSEKVSLYEQNKNK